MDNPFQRLTPEFQRSQPWYKVAQAFFDVYKLTEHQLDSFNLFMREKLPSIITGTEFEYTKDDIHYIGTFGNVYVKRPEFTEPSGVTRKLKPQDCRMRNLNYMCRVFADITRYTVDANGKVKDSDTKLFSDVYLGSIPCMVMSEYCNLYGKDETGLIKNGECPQEVGGYFIINGSEKVLMSQDRMAHNEIFVFDGKDKDTIKVPIPGTDKNCSLPLDWYAEVRSSSITEQITTTCMRLSKQQLDKGEDQRLYIEVPGLKAPVAWPIIFMALGVTTVDEMITYVCDKDDIPMITLLSPSLECPLITSQKEALEYLSGFVLTTQKDQRMEYLKRILREKLFQNVTQTHMKRFYLGHMTHQLLATVLGRRKEDDRDHYAKKRVETAGPLINNLFKSVWKRIIREVTNNLIKKRTNDLAQLFFGKITNYIKPPFASGNWTATKSTNKPAKVGISQILNRHNFVSTISALRRVVTPNDKNSKIIKPRHLHGSQWSMICPFETPEGQTAGLIKNLSMLATISLGSPEDQIMDWLEMNSNLIDLMHQHNKITPIDIKNKTKVFVNGSWIGCTGKAIDLVGRLRKLRRSGKISHEVSISVTKEGVRVYTDEGRLLEPYFIVYNGALKNIPDDFNWQDLLDKGIIEYLDPAELETIKHAVFPWKIDTLDSHCLIHPSFLMGASASTAPFSDHNQSPRNVYQSAMGKQALGIFAGNFLHRYDTNAHVLCYPQKPIVDSAVMRLMRTHELPSGQNLIVAVMSAAYNQEDSVMVNKRAIDTGALRSLCYTTYSESCHRKGNTLDEIKRPEKASVKETRIRGYNKLDADGLSKEGTPLCKRDVVIGKVNSTTEMVRDTSVVIKTNGMEETAVVEVVRDGQSIYEIGHGSASVDRALLTINEESFRTTKARVRQMRIPQIGDKVASRHAQKGIIGMEVSPENMPYSQKTGMTPDLLMNPNAFPSRMTIGQALECFLGKACVLNGANGDCTAFEPEFNRHVITDELKKFGFDEAGDEIMINGMTGEEIPCKIFMGPTYYQRLKHMVDDKIHCLSLDHEVLTIDGWKQIGTVTIDDQVATLKDGVLVYEHPEDVLYYPDYEGPMYHIKNQAIDLSVTGNHRMWTSKPYGRKKTWTEYAFERADEIVGKHRKYKKDAQWLEPTYQFVLPATDNCEEYPVDMDAWLTFMGIWYAEGWADVRKNKVSIAANKNRVKDSLLPALDILGFTYSMSADEKVTVYHEQLYNYMRPLSVGASNKVLPSWVFELDVDQTRTLIHGMLLGDGTFAKNGCSFYYTTSTVLADQFQQLCLHAGWASMISTHLVAGNSKPMIQGRVITSNHDVLRCSVIKNRINPSVNHGHQSVQEESLVIEQCPVACLTVSSGVFYVRRNGKAVWTGNSRDQDGPRETLTRQPVEGRKRGGGFRMGEMETWCGISHGRVRS